MRTAIFVGLLRIAIAIKPLSPESNEGIIFLIVIFMVMDIIDTGKK